MQEVKPVKGQLKKDRGLHHFNVWMPQHLTKRLKLGGAQGETSLTQITIKAIGQSLNLYMHL